MKHASLPLALAATAVLLWQSVTPAQACTCATVTPEEQVAAADTVVVGSVVDYRGVKKVRLSDDDHVSTWTQVVVDVQRYLKGSGPSMIAIEELQGCGEILGAGSAGGEYVLLMTGEESPFQTTGYCSGSLPLADEYEQQIDDPTLPAGFIVQSYEPLNSIVLITGPGVAPTTNDVPTVPFAIAAVALPLAFVLAAAFVFPAKVSRA